MYDSSKCRFLGAGVAWCRACWCVGYCVSLIHMKNFCAFALLLLALVLPGASSAETIPATSSPRYSQSCVLGTDFPSMMELAQACASANYTYFRANGYPSCNYAIAVDATTFSLQPDGTSCGGNGYGVRTASITNTYTCPPGYTLGGSTCTGSALTVAKNVAWTMTALDQVVQVPIGQSGLDFCKDGVSYSGEWSAADSDPNLKNIYGPFTTEAASCSPGVTGNVADPATETEKAAAQPPHPWYGCKGFAGTVNGQDKCIATVADSGLGVTGTIGSTKTDSDGTVTLKTGVVTCELGKCTVTETTTTTPSGGGTSTSSSTTTTQKQGDFCTANPKAGVCTGTADNGCKANPTSVGCSTLGKLSGDVPSRTENVSFGSVDTGLSNTGACPAPISYASSNGTVTIDLAPFCSNISTYVRPVVIAMGALMAFMLAWPRSES